MTILQKKRIIWIDWFKSIAMLSIIWGHMFPYYFTDFLYSFSVPAFFWASGYLSKKGEDNQVFYKNLWKNLCVPYLMICFINLILCILIFHRHYFTIYGIVNSLVAIPLGIQSYVDNSAVGVGPMWFVYTLILIKIIHHLTNRTFLIWASVISLLVVWLFNFNGLALALTSTLICLPFYTIGVCCQAFNNKQSLKSNAISLIIIIIGILSIALYILSSVNHAPYLYKLGYGENVFLMVLNAIVGIVILYLVSNIMEKIIGGGNSYRRLVQAWL